MEWALMLIVLSLLTGCKHQVDTIPSKIDVILPFDKNPSGNWQVGYSLHDNLSMSIINASIRGEQGNSNAISLKAQDYIEKSNNNSLVGIYDLTKPKATT